MSGSAFARELPLCAAGKLGVILFQFAPWFVYGKTGYTHILRAREMLPGDRIAVEFRNKSWLDEKHRDRVLAFEREHELAHVIVDAPQGFASSVLQEWEATSPEIAIVRLHGRNRATWQAKGLPSSAERFEYLYSDTELAEFADPLRVLSSKVEAVHVLFNNCYTDYATRNATSLTRLLARGA